MIVTVIRQIIDLAGTGDRALETICLGDDVVGQDAAIGPATNAEALRVGVTLGYRVIHCGHDVFEVLDAPFCKNRCRKVLPITARATRIRYDHDITIRGEELGIPVKRKIILRDRASVNAEDGRVFLARIVVRWRENESLDLRAVGTGESNVLDSRKPSFIEQAVIGMRHLV